MTALISAMAAVAMQTAAVAHGAVAAAPAAPAASAAAPAAPAASAPAAAAAAPAAPGAAAPAPVAATAAPAAAPPPDLVTAPPAAGAVAARPVATAPPAQDAGPAAPVFRGPVESRFNVRLDIDTVWYTKQSFDLFSSHDTSLFPGVSIGYAVFHSEPISLIPELGFSANSEDASSLFGGALAHTTLASKNAYAGVSVRWGLLSILDLAARLSGGASFVHIELEPNISNTALLKDDGTSPFMTLGGGFTVHTPTGTFQTNSGALRSLIAGLSVEGGYVLGGSVELTPKPSDSGRINTTYMSLGRLDRSGPYIKTSLTARF